MSDCCFISSKQFFSYITTRTRYNLMRWWCLLCTRSTWDDDVYFVL